jgi:hypothetical protein
MSRFSTKNSPIKRKKIGKKPKKGVNPEVTLALPWQGHKIKVRGRASEPKNV